MTDVKGKFVYIENLRSYSSDTISTNNNSQGNYYGQCYNNLYRTPIFSLQGTYSNNFYAGFTMTLPAPLFSLPSLNISSLSAAGGSSASSSSFSAFSYNSGSRTSIQLTGSLSNYNANKGERLARIARSGITGWAPKGQIGNCAQKVKTAIQKAGLGEYIYNTNGCDIADAYKNNPNFREISAAGLDLKKLPAGCILCYGPGVSKYNKKYGHTEITLGDGTAASNGHTHNIRPGARVLIPV